MYFQRKKGEPNKYDHVKYKHPNILGVIEPMIEDKYIIAFISEKVSYSLSSLEYINSDVPVV